MSLESMASNLNHYPRDDGLMHCEMRVHYCTNLLSLNVITSLVSTSVFDRRDGDEVLLILDWEAKLQVGLRK